MAPPVNVLSIATAVPPHQLISTRSRMPHDMFTRALSPATRNLPRFSSTRASSGAIPRGRSNG